MFSSAFSSAFARFAEPVEYISPMLAQAALGDGAGWGLVGGVLMIEGAILIGPAGKTYSFASPESAARWVEHTRAAGIRQQLVVTAMSPEIAETWKEKKREKLAVVAERLVSAAAKQSDAARRAALVAESDYCLVKWLL
jgi:hypothetical protein